MSDQSRHCQNRKQHARTPVFGQVASAPAAPRARDGAPGQLPSHDMRDFDALQLSSDRHDRYVSLLLPTGGLRVLNAPLRLACAHHLGGRRGAELDARQGNEPET